MIVESGKKPKAIAINVWEQTRGWLNAVNLHWAGVALLALINIFLLVQMGLAWRLANSQNAEALAQQRIELKGAELAARPLQGLDVKLADAGEKADQFYLERLPVSYSQIATELGALKNRSGVRLTRVNYAQPAPGKAGTVGVAPTGSGQSGGPLTEVSMDASLTGDYRSLMTFINGLERDKVFFLISGVTLTGQQTGQVSLRIRLTTYMRGLIPGADLDRANGAEPGSAAATAGSGTGGAQ